MQTIENEQLTTIVFFTLRVLNSYYQAQNSVENHWLKMALNCHSEEAIEKWVHAFLLGPGRNEALSTGLKLCRRYWIGPLRIPLASLLRICGPEAHSPYRQAPSDWEKAISSMLASLAAGWTPPPFILEYKAAMLHLCDGNHRHEALRRAGISHHWAFIWCNDATDYEACLQTTF
ncbi:MAG: chromosome partitioning protein ParB [Bacteroidetes bacterium]|nr:MAG: chromosome partitioning protein ParB [Bacteroidota bacterium]